MSVVSGSVDGEGLTMVEGGTFGDYRIVRALGSGGMGEVYEAVHAASGRHVAVKIMSQRLDSETDRKRFLREGRLAAAVSHPNAVYIFGTEEIDGRPVIVMELVRAGTLKERVETDGPLPVDEAVDAILNVIDGLEAAAAAGVLHRDIKPANCFVDTDGTVKIGDFGLSISTQARPESMLTATGTVMGTPSFASPEQLRGQPLDVASDIYGVGATLYFLLTGRTPHSGRELVHLITQVLQESPEPPHQVRSEIPRGLSRVVTRCLAKSRDARYPDYAALRMALSPWTSAAPSPATLARRTAAGFVDSIALIVLYVIPGLADGAESVLGQTPSGLAAAAVYTALLIAYYAIPEALWGATPAKALLGLRVVDRTGGPPTVGRALARSTIFNASDYLSPVLLLAVITPAEFTEYDGRVEALIFGLKFALWIGLFVTVRRRNGFAAVHGLVTGTRVVNRPATEHHVALGLVTAGGGSMSGDDPAPAIDGAGDAPDRFGPYVARDAFAELRGARLLLGADPVLARQVVIVECTGPADALPAGRRDLSRRARLRWLGGERSETRSWDAFELPAGAPLGAAPLPDIAWPAVRSWLRDLAEALRAGLDEPATAAPASLDRVWITRDGRLLLLDFPAPGTQGQAAGATADSDHDGRPVRDADDVQAFLASVARTALARQGGGDVGPESVPIPLHASEFLSSLDEGQHESVDAILTSLDAMRHHPARVTAGRRIASVAVPSALIFMMVLIGSLVSNDFNEGWAEAHPDLTSPDRLVEVYRDTDLDTVNVRPAVERVLAARYASILSDSAFWRDPELTGPLRRFRPIALEAIETDRPAAAELARADSILEPLIRDASRSERVSLTVITTGGGVFIGALLSALAAILIGRHVLLAASGIAVVDRRGRRAGRLRLLWRTICGWIFAALLVPLGVSVAAVLARALDGTSAGAIGDPLPLIGILAPGQGDLFMLVGAVVIGAAVALLGRFPDRAPQDHLAGTRLVPR